MNEAQRAQSILFNWFDTISEASSDFSSRYRLSSRSADALQAALPEEQLQMWSQRYRCPPRAASLDNLPRLKKLRDDLADKELAFLMQTGELAAEKQIFPSRRRCQDVKWLVVFVMMLVCIASYCTVMIQQAIIFHTDELDLTQPPWQDMAVSSLAGCIAALLVAASYVFLPMCFPHTMVWVFLLGSPVCLILSGSTMAAFHAGIGGGILLGIGIILLMLLFFWFSRLCRIYRQDGFRSSQDFDLSKICTCP